MLFEAARTGTFWALAASFFVCGATTVGLIAVHFIPAAHDHGMPATTAAGMLAVMGILDIAGTTASDPAACGRDSRIGPRSGGGPYGAAEPAGSTRAAATTGPATR